MATNVIIRDHSEILMRKIFESIISEQAEEWTKPDHNPSTFWEPLESPNRKNFKLYPVASSFVEEATNVSLEVHDGVLSLFVLNTDGRYNTNVPAVMIGVKYPNGKLVDIWINISSDKFDEKIRGAYYYL